MLSSLLNNMLPGFELGLRFFGGLALFIFFRCMGELSLKEQWSKPKGWGFFVLICLLIAGTYAYGSDDTCLGQDHFGCIEYANDGEALTQNERDRRFGSSFGAILFVGAFGFMRGAKYIRMGNE